MDINEQLKGWLQQQAQPGSFLDKVGLGLAQAGQTLGQDAQAGAAIMNDPRNSWIGMNPLGKMAGAGLGLAGALGQVAYHGSPHLFEKFAMSKIGTGEGAQAFGHGLYFAENPRVAKGYAGPAGTMYKTDLPDEAVAKMLDWDKPLSEHSQEAIAALEKSGLLDELRQFYGKEADPLRMTGGEFYRGLAETEAEASKRLMDAGIPGLRYLDGMSRKGGTGTSNFVVFDDQLPVIKERGGLELAK